MTNWPLILIQAITGTIMLISLFGLIVPIYPGLTVIWGAALFYGIVVGFKALGWVAWLIFGFMTVLMIFGNVIDNFVTAKKSYDSGASGWSIAIAIVAGVIGSIVWTLLGGMVIAPVALFLAEYYRLRDRHRAFEATKGWIIGLGWAFVIKFLVGAAMIGIWMIWAINSH